MRIDAHVHLFPERLAAAVRRWFETHAWRFSTDETVEEGIARLTRGGLERLVALPYAHKPGMAASLNDFTLALAARFPAVVPCCTAFPGEPGAEGILESAFERGARAVKIHCHVMKVPPDDPRLDPVFRVAARHRRPVVIHAGREPASEGYGVDVHSISGAARTRRMLDRHPETTVIVPHLGGDEIEEFERMLGEYPRLYLDTAVVLSGLVGPGPDLGILARHPDRILYGSDYPTIPYSWDRELRIVLDAALPAEARERILGGNAGRLFDVR